MVDKEILNDLANMYRLLKAIQGAQQVLLDQVQDHIKARGLDAVTGLKGDTVAQQFVENVLGVHKKYYEMIKDYFQGRLLCHFFLLLLYASPQGCMNAGPS